MKFNHIGLLSAMPEEIGTITNDLKDIKKTSFGDFKIYSGIWKKDEDQFIYLSVAFSGWGKVSAARATTRLISIAYKNVPVELILFTGVAASAQENIKQWDIVLGECLIQHDMDATPLFDKFVIPSLNKKELVPPKKIFEFLFEKFKEFDTFFEQSNFGMVKRGVIASGDQFVSDENTLKKILLNIPTLSAIEMEGASFAQVSIQENIPWLVIRVISDNAKEGSEDDFNKFVQQYKFHSHKLISFIVESFI